jgi:hypothetical protein
MVRKFFNDIQLNQPKGGGNISVPPSSKPSPKIPMDAKLVGRTSQRGNALDKAAQMRTQGKQTNQQGKPATGSPFANKDFAPVGPQVQMDRFVSDAAYRQQQMSTPEGRTQFRQNFLTAMRGNPEGISSFFQRWNEADAAGGTTTATPGYEPGAKGVQESLMRKIDRTYRPVDLAPKNSGNQGGISKELAFALSNKGENGSDDSRYGSRGGDGSLRNPRTRDKYVNVNGNTIRRDALYGKPNNSQANQSTTALYSPFTNSYRFPGQDYGQQQPLLNSPATAGYQTNLLQPNGAPTGQVTPIASGQRPTWNPGYRAGQGGGYFVPPNRATRRK